MLVSEKLMILISFLLSMSLNCSYIIYSHCLKFEEKVIKSDEVDTQINTMILWRENKQWIQWRSSANKQQQLHGFVKSHHWSAFQSKKKTFTFYSLSLWKQTVTKNQSRFLLELNANPNESCKFIQNRILSFLNVFAHIKKKHFSTSSILFISFYINWVISVTNWIDVVLSFKGNKLDRLWILQWW